MLKKHVSCADTGLRNEVSAPPTVMTPYSSPDGFQVPARNWLAIPQLSLMRDEAIRERASTFEGFRYIHENNESSTSRFTHPSFEVPF